MLLCGSLRFRMFSILIRIGALFMTGGDAAEIRSRVILEVLGAAREKGVEALWIGRDLGHRGGRRTGLALTDDLRFGDHFRRWGVDAERPTVGPLVAERTAAVIWEMLGRISENVFLWNVFPLHPFPPGNPFGNRAHNAAERKAGVAVLRSLLALLNPGRIVAIGNDAAKVAANLGAEIEVCAVRHPGYGGEALFREQMAALYGLKNRA